MPQVKVIQLNFWKGKFFDEAVEFLLREVPDIITLQEVTGGSENLAEDWDCDLFAVLKRKLAGYDARQAVVHRVIDDHAAYVSNAIFVKAPIRSTRTLWLSPYREEMPHHLRDHTRSPRNALDCAVMLCGMRMRVVSVHAGWTPEPVDTPEKIKQARLLAAHIKKIGSEPFIIGGDFNMPPGSAVENIITSVCCNAVCVPTSRITHTINYRIHVNSNSIPRGLIVDYILTSPHFRIASIDAPDVDISDHLPVRTMLTLSP